MVNGLAVCDGFHVGSWRATYGFMLKITIQEGARNVSLKLEGRVVGPWVAEFERTWHSLAPSLDGKKLSVDLCGVTYIDSEGREILAEIYRQTRAQFSADTPLTKYFVEQAQNSNSHNGNGKGASNERSLWV